MVNVLNALVTGNDATDISDADAAELNNIDSYLSSTYEKVHGHSRVLVQQASCQKPLDMFVFVFVPRFPAVIASSVFVFVVCSI